LERIISEESEKEILTEDQKKIESEGQIVMKQHKPQTGPNCKMGNHLSCVSNEKDLKFLSESKEETGIVKAYQNQKMDDWDWKLVLELDNI